GRFSAMYKPFHLIGLELNISILSAALLKKPTGSTLDFNSDVVATAKRGLKAGEILDGEGGFTVYGKLMPASKSLKMGGLPIGLAHHVKLKNNVNIDQQISWDDVEIDLSNKAVSVRKEMEKLYS
ncbi:MAG TPA: flagellar biosynthesis protein FlgA, partial [Gammaproteobacteria bacterium]|nr:flagellar biosynthesis protein FlgA [Gammaproteobacteria bacterium]